MTPPHAPPARHDASPSDQVERLSLDTAVQHLLEECRMVLPGIQGLLGFQFIAVFNTRFTERLTSAQQTLHIGAIVLTAIAIALVMAPAAMHRQCEPRTVSARFLALSSRLVLASMLPLALAIGADVYIVSSLVFASSALSVGLTVAVLAVFAVLWFALPRWALPRREP